LADGFNRDCRPGDRLLSIVGGKSCIPLCPRRAELWVLLKGCLNGLDRGERVTSIPLQQDQKEGPQN
jgi:hypothetical protein